MMHHRIALAAAAMVLASCASVPRDAGLSNVQRTVADATGREIVWRTQPEVSEQERVAAILADELTADEAVQLAMVNSPRLQVALAEIGIARADLIEASTIANPLLEFEIRFPGEPYRPYELRLAQSLIELIQLPRRRALGRAAFAAAQMRVSSEVLRFAGDVRAAYYELIAASQHVAMSRAIHEATKTSAELALKQHAAQNITDLDLEIEQARYEEAKLDLAAAEQRLLASREVLIRGMGLRDQTAEWRVPEAFPPLPESEMTETEIEELAAAQRLDLAIARRELEVAQRQVPIARLSILEHAELDFHYEREPSGERTRGPGIEFPIPIFNTGRAARSRAEAEFLRARHLLQALTAESSSQLRVARTALAEARARVEYYRDVVLPRRRRIVELTKLEHNAMLLGLYQLLEARENELQAHRDYIDAQRDYWTARTDLDRATQGVADDMTFSAGTAQARGRRAGAGRGEGH